MNTSIAGDRAQGLRDSLKEDAPWGAVITFLDSINSIEELDELVPILNAAKKEDLVSWYRGWLATWKNPRLPDGFAEKCPLLSARLDTPQKIRILLRGADFRDVTPLVMGEVLEDIIRRHEVKGEKKVVYVRYRGDQRCDALRIVYHTQVQAWTLTRLALPEYQSIGAGTGGLFIDWRTEEQRKAAGERH
ncbi:MAG: hypothetical protein WC790_02845 [Candidatus Paceibacterota bacterium]|jgi:hypothetical protein